MNTATPLFIEQRFPVGLDPVVPSIRALYDQSKAAHWDPQADIDWAAFSTTQYTPEQLHAAQLSWSRRAWVEYTALAETPSLLVRFCIERGREADPKFYLTVRNTEEAWHIESCHRFADLCGGYLEQPSSSAYAENLNRNFHREVLHAETPLDAYVAAHCAISDGLEFALWDAYSNNASNPVARQLLERCVRDKARHASFGWMYLDARRTHWDKAIRTQIEQYVSSHIHEVELAGYHCVSLADDTDSERVALADATTAQAGLGALAPREERKLTAIFLASALERLAGLQINIELPENARLHT